jgi:hypothetical protein
VKLLNLFFAYGSLALISNVAQGALVIDTFPGTNTTNGWLGTAQTITGPAIPNTILTDYRFELAPRSGAGAVTFSIQQWSGDAPTGPTLFTQNIPWSSGGLVDVTGINLPLVPGTLYGMIIDLQGYDQLSVSYGGDNYSGGNGFWTFDVNGVWTSFPNLDHSFRAVFAETAGVPEPLSFVVWFLLALVFGGACSWKRSRLVA